MTITSEMFGHALHKQAVALLQRLKPILYFRNPIMLLRLLFGDASLQHEMILRPTRIYEVRNGVRDRVYKDCDSGTRWEELQAMFPDGVTLLQLMFFSDKANVSTIGNRQAYPLLLNLGKNGVKHAAEMLLFLTFGYF